MKIYSKYELEEIGYLYGGYLENAESDGSLESGQGWFGASLRSVLRSLRCSESRIFEFFLFSIKSWFFSKQNIFIFDPRRKWSVLWWSQNHSATFGSNISKTKFFDPKIENFKKWEGGIILKKFSKFFFRIFRRFRTFWVDLAQKKNFENFIFKFFGDCRIFENFLKSYRLSSKNHFFREKICSWNGSTPTLGGR